MDKVTAVQIKTKFGFEFAPINKNITELINIEKADAGYADTQILNNITMRILAGQRIGLLGRNGEGKSTLIKLICGEINNKVGELTRNKHFNAGYFAQHQVEQLNLDQSPVWHIQSLGDAISEQDARNFLGGFAFHGDKTQDKVSGFSGGEKARLVLAMITWMKPNLLLLDEPTNHFDIEMREALSLSLQDFDGAVLLVAHDKSLMESVVDEFWLVNDGQVNPFMGDLKDYQKWLNENRWGVNDKATSGNATDDKINSAAAKKEQKRLEAEKRQQKAPLTNRRKKVEKLMDALQQKLAQVEQKLTDTSIYEDKNKQQLTQTIEESNQFKNELASLEEEWMTLTEELELLS
jgi:ATP-binding cassette, subfamily F, member 3